MILIGIIEIVHPLCIKIGHQDQPAYRDTYTDDIDENPVRNHAFFLQQLINIMHRQIDKHQVQKEHAKIADLVHHCSGSAGITRKNISACLR